MPGLRAIRPFCKVVDALAPKVVTSVVFGTLNEKLQGAERDQL